MVRRLLEASPCAILRIQTNNSCSRVCLLLHYFLSLTKVMLRIYYEYRCRDQIVRPQIVLQTPNTRPSQPWSTSNFASSHAWISRLRAERLPGELGSTGPIHISVTGAKICPMIVVFPLSLTSPQKDSSSYSQDHHLTFLLRWRIVIYLATCHNILQ